MDTIERTPALSGDAAPALSPAQPPSGQTAPTPTPRRSGGHFLANLPFIAMFALALVGIFLRLQVAYWVVLTPIFCVISVAEGWRSLMTPRERVRFVAELAMTWCALLLAIYLLFNSGVTGVMNVSASSLAMVILLALGTFISGVQARVWQICAVGAALFVAVPALGWLDQSLMLVAGVGFLVLASIGVAWWVSQR